MGYKELVDMEDELQNQPDLEQLALGRAPHVQQLINDFIAFYEQKYGIALSSMDDLAIKLSYLYFSMCYEHLKPVMDEQTNRFKLASLMELIIVKEQVLLYPNADKAENRKLNALFGMTAAFSLLNCMIDDATQEFFCNTMNAAVNEKVQKMLDDHYLWLTTKQLSDLPVFINAQFYELIEVIHEVPLQLNGF